MLSRSRSVLMSFGLPLAVVGTILLLFLYFPSHAAQNGSFVVNTTADIDDGACTVINCSLREAITAANDSAGEDTITFSLPPNATITLNGSQLPVITDDLVIDGSSAVNLTLSGNDASRLMVIGAVPPPYPGPNERPEVNQKGPGPAVTLISLVLTNGNQILGLGGSVYNDGSLTILDSTVKDTLSKHGAVYNNNILVVKNSSFINNSGTALFAGGAGIYNSGSGFLTVWSSLFADNSAEAPASNGGGGILNMGGQLVVKNSVFEGNSAANFGGGAMNLSGGTNIIDTNTFTDNYSSSYGGAIEGGGFLTITNSSFTGNAAVGAAGAVHISGVSNNKSILNSTFNNNSSQDGGAVFVSGVATIANSTFYNNTADTGGAIYIGEYLGDLTLVNSTISGNSASNLGGGIFNNRILDMSNTIVANSLNGSDCVNVGTIGVNVKNLIEDGSCSPAFSANPLLGPLTNNDGPTMTMLPLPGSPAIDTGNNAMCADRDQRGWLRPADGDENGTAVCDIGAVEVGKWLEFMAVVLKG